MLPWVVPEFAGSRAGEVFLLVLKGDAALGRCGGDSGGGGRRAVPTRSRAAVSVWFVTGAAGLWVVQALAASHAVEEFSLVLKGVAGLGR
ncbi:hypothetical protein GCM10027184_22690 [Saccharothrix stipae]